MKMVAVAVGLVLAVGGTHIPGRIVFERPAGLVISRADGSHQRLLTRAEAAAARDVDPRWSPDGTRVVFNRRVASGWQVWIVNATGGGARPLSVIPWAEHPQWAPNGKLVAYNVQTDYGSGGGVTDTSFDLHVIRPDGSGDRVVASGGSGGSTSSAVEAGTEWAWSPDSRSIAYETTAAYTSVPRHQIRLLDLASGDSRVIGDGIQVAWAAKGRRLAIGHGDRFDRPGPCKPITVLALATMRQRAIPEAAAHCDTDPSWSRDGRYIAFIRDGFTYKPVVWVVRSDGSHRRRLARGDIPLRWTSNNQLLFTAGHWIERIAPTGGPARRIAQGSAPDWHR